MITFMCLVASVACFAAGLSRPSSAFALVGLFWALVFTNRIFRKRG